MIIKNNAVGLDKEIKIARADENHVFKVDGEERYVRGPIHIFSAIKQIGVLFPTSIITWEGKRKVGE